MALVYKTDAVHGTARVFEDLSVVEKTIAFVFFYFVWYGFMRCGRRKQSTAIFLALFNNIISLFVIPSRFFFTYVQTTVVGINSALVGLTRTDKDKYYDMEAILVDIPIVSASFVEAMGCESFLMSIGGHVWYDLVVPVSFFLYYGAVAVDHASASKEKKV